MVAILPTVIEKPSGCSVRKVQASRLLVAGMVGLSGLSSAQAQMAGLISTGGSCSSQGAWTQKALDQANSIYETVHRLQSDPNCKGMAAAISGSAFSGADSGSGVVQESYRAETIMQELQSLRTVLSSSKNPQAAKILNPILAQTALESMTSVSGSSTTPDKNQALGVLKNRFSAASGRGLDMLNSLFSTMPSYTQCMQERPDLAANLFVGGVRMASAFASGGQGISPKFAETISNFLNFIQDQKFASIQKKLNQQKFWTEISCLIETTQANYCAVQDGFELLKSQKQMAAKSFRGTPLEGYFIMSREIPEVSAWIQKIQIGIEPRLTTDAQFKKDTWASIVRLYNDSYDLPAMYFENLNTVYKNLSTQQQKMNNIRSLIASLTNVMSGESSRGTNFFIQTVNATTIPFFLLGRDSVPREVIAPGAAKIAVMDYLLDPELTPEMKNPDETMSKILVRLRELMDRAMITGAEYFRNRMSVDQVNLIDESITSSAISARQGLINIRGYLKNLFLRFQNDRDAQAMLPSIMDTMSRIDRILVKFDMLDREAQKLKLQIKNGGYSLDNLANYDGDRRKEMTSGFETIITAVYLEFNILLQRDGFFSTRMGTYVRKDYYSRANREDFSQYTNQLLITSGRSILDRLQEYMKFNMAESESDLSTANVINMENLEQVEDLVIGHVENYIIDLNKKSGHGFTSIVNPSVLQGLNPLNLNPFSSKRVWIAAKQDKNNEAENVRAKVCIQTLGFKRYRRFMLACNGAKLKSTLVAKDGRMQLPLEMDYNTLLKKRMAGDGYVNTILNSSLMPAENRFSQVCLLRDYYRNNLVAWLTQNYSKNH